MISIIIPSYNKFNLLIACIDHILKGTYKNIEVIVVDNNSSEKKNNLIYKECIKYIWLTQNTGFSKAVNIGIKQSKGDYIAVLNNDTEVDPNWITNVIRTFDQNPDVMYITSKIKNLKNPELLDDVGDIILPSGKVYKIGNNEKDEGQYEQQRYIFGASGCASVFRREFFDKVGYYDEDFFAYLEDIDLSFRANLLGYRCLYVPDAIVYHFGSATTGSQYNDFTVYHFAQNTINVIVKNFPAVILLRSLLPILTYIMSLQVFFLAKGYGVPYFKGLIMGIRSIKKMLRKRRDIIGRQVITNNELLNLFKENKKLYMLSKMNRGNHIE